MHIWRHPMLTPTNLFSAFFLQVHNDSVITFGLLTFLWFCKCVEHCLNQALNVFKTNAINTSFRKRPGSLKNYLEKIFWTLYLWIIEWPSKSNIKNVFILFRFFTKNWDRKLQLLCWLRYFYGYFLFYWMLLSGKSANFRSNYR